MKLVVALDLPNPNDNKLLVEKLNALPDEQKAKVALKIGLNTFIAAGPSFVADAKQSTPFDLILDLKLHDIPNTMAAAARRAAELKVSALTVHASAGQAAIREVVRALTGPAFPNAPKVFAVTVLTSMEKEACESIYKRSTFMQAKHLAIEALHGGADGIVCSPQELPFIDQWVADEMARSGPPRPLLKLVPGIELEPRKDDQKRKGGLKEVIEGKADLIVVGRPIYMAMDPAEVVVKILNKIDTMTALLDQYNAEAKW